MAEPTLTSVLNVDFTSPASIFKSWLPLLFTMKSPLLPPSEFTWTLTSSSPTDWISNPSDLGVSDPFVSPPNWMFIAAFVVPVLTFRVLDEYEKIPYES